METSIEELINKGIPEQGLKCSVGGYYYHYGARIPACPKGSSIWLNQSQDANDPYCIFIPEKVGKIVGQRDEIIGVLVGGPYAYAGVHAMVDGHVVRQSDGQLVFTTVNNVTLFQNEKRVEIEITE